jgi:beta-lactamase regulating signal transducer with metallopeptidase domain
MNWLNNISDTAIKSIFAFIFIIGLIVGFFMKIVSPEIFVGIASSVITHYFNNEQNKTLQKQIDQKDNQIQALSIVKQ